MARWPLNPLKGRNTSRDHRQQLEELNLPMTMLNSLDEIIVENPSEGQVQQVMRSDFQEEISAQDPSEGRIPQVMRSDCLEEISLEDEAKDVEDLAVGNEIENDSEELLHLISGVYLDLLRRLVESRSGTGVREDVGSIRSRHRLGRRCASSIGEQITHTIEIMIPKSMACLDDPRRKELEELEKEKIMIDEKANVLVRRELWGGLGFLIVQTSAFMVLTFWKLSWVVMEPIWFCATSIYLIAGYVFFLRTSRDPSLGSFYESRFKAKQKWLMKNKNFDIKGLTSSVEPVIPFSLNKLFHL
ncbi:calcium uniporter protein 5, mitochondrial-like [Macadamia integrifolia]|uniref:calcium uniporter protein 5, mitochondrial-like n=1 Tax=Macadamia integrifolia TaxID=60698 RepID=UPI001C4EE304|nr:calcium uniporter protein 5, mitochondrial-like [Macadamia integrifolia]